MKYIKLFSHKKIFLIMRSKKVKHDFQIISSN